jgi:hypothetical protein
MRVSIRYSPSAADGDSATDPLKVPYGPSGRPVACISFPLPSVTVTVTCVATGSV